MRDLEIVVTGYPKSGNTWLIWLLGMGLNLTQQDMPGQRVVKHWPDSDRNLYGVIRKQHRIKPNFISDNAVVVQMRRDPRDVFISALHYGKRESIADTVQWLEFTLAEAEGTGKMPYVEWVGTVESSSNRVFSVHYEDLHTKPIAYFSNLLEVILFNHPELLEPAIKKLPAVVEACSFENMQSQLGDHYCRKGTPGQWEQVLSKADGKLIDNLPGMREYLQTEYNAPPDWWQGLE